MALMAQRQSDLLSRALHLQAEKLKKKSELAAIDDELTQLMLEMARNIKGPDWLTANIAETQYGVTNAQLRYAASHQRIDCRKEGTVILYRETDVERLSGERKTAGGKQARNNP